MALPGRVQSYPRSVTPNVQEARVRWLAGTFFLAPVVVVAWLLLPHGDVASAGGVAAMAGAALSLGVVLHLLPSERIPDFALKSSIFVATTVISGGVLFGGDSGSTFALFYFWSVPYAFAYFTPRDGVRHTLWVGVCYAIVLAVQRHNGVTEVHHPIGRWLVLVGSLAVVGTLVREITQWGRDSDARFRRGFDDSPAPMAVVALDGTTIEVNDALCRLLGHAPAELEGQPFGDGLVHPDDLAAGRAAFVRIAEPGGAFATLDLRLLQKGGGVVVISLTASVVRDAHQHAQYYFVQAQDVTSERGSVEELRRRGLQQQAIARLGQLALVERDLAAFMQHLARTITDTLGIERATVLELDGAEFLVAAGVGWPEGIVGTLRTPAHSRSPAALALSSKEPVVIDDIRADMRFEVPPIVHALGLRSGVAAVVDGQADAFGVLVVYATELRNFDADDVAFVQAAANVLASAVDRRRSDDANRHAALHDPLTGLANRTLALDRLQHALARRQREGTKVAVLVLDLDRFKVINDSLGHDAGDELLLQLAPRLCDAVRPTDTVARLGGDEFIVVCESIAGPSDAKHLAERMAAAVARPLLLQSGEHFLTASIGLAISGTDADTPETLLRDADAAMYRAKDGGRGRHELFDDGMREQALLRMQTESELRRAIDGRELRVHYQPIVDVVSGRTVGVEALARWQHPERGLLGPGEFIAVAEEVGLISRLGSWVLTEASNQVAAWQRTFGPLELCVNVSGRQLASPGFADEVAMIAQESGIMAGTLGLEITESVLIEDATAPVAVLSDLHDRGLRLLLDDFGTGYSSLSYVKNFPLDSLKLDRSFIAGLGQHAEDTAIVQAVISMARAVGMGVVAEGVETPAQVARLLSLGCERAQGYLFARPMPADELELFLAEPVPAAVA